MQERETHDEVADRAERGADDLEEQTGKLGEQIHRTREDWDSKLSSNDAPGAAKPEEAAPGGEGAPEEEGDERNEEAGEH